MQKKNIAYFLLGFFILLSAVFMVYYYKLSHETPKKLPYIGEGDHIVRSFSFTDQNGKTVTQADVKGKVYVVEYFFTTCKGICPKMNENMTKVYQTYKGNKEVKILSHTVDPKKDTVAALKAYSERFGAEAPQWEFLTGDKKELYDMARYSYLVTAVDDTGEVDIQSDFIHTEKFVLVDGTGHIRGIYDGTKIGEVNQLIGDIQELLKEEKP
jgi:protein SCO1/2